MITGRITLSSATSCLARLVERNALVKSLSRLPRRKRYVHAARLHSRPSGQRRMSKIIEALNPADQTEASPKGGVKIRS